jgi:RNA polymerase sigma factor (sigma-70 family)
MDQPDSMAERFEEHRARLTALAYRMLGTPSEAEDAVQDAWLRLSRSDAGSVENLGNWLTTVVSRVCLNMLHARRTRPEVPLGPEVSEPVASLAAGSDPEQEALLADSIGLALLIVLDMLTPAERVAFVLHDMFAVPFDEIAPIVGRSATAARQLASRARRRVQGANPVSDVDLTRQRRVVAAFLAASRNRDFHALLAVLDPDVVLRADEAAVQMGAAPETRGAAAVAEFCRRAGGARPALVDGVAGAVWMPGGEVRVVFDFTVAAGRIAAIDLIADPARLRDLDLTIPGE